MTLFHIALAVLGVGGIGGAIALGFGPAMLLFARSAAGFIGSWLSKRSLTEIACMVFAAAFLVQTARIDGVNLWLVNIDGLQSQLSHARTALTNERNARKADRSAYERAQLEAAAKNRADVAAKEAQSQRISDNAKTAYARDLAELRRLRANSAAPARPSGSAHPPQGRPAPGGADADGLQLPPDEHLQASEIELRLMHLQNWVIEQLK